MTLSEDKAKIFSRNKSRVLAPSQQSRPKRDQENAERNGQPEDRPKIQPVTSAVAPQTVQVQPPAQRDDGGGAPQRQSSGKEANLVTSQLESKSSLVESGVASQSTITHEMSTAEALDLLGHHGCDDVTEKLDTSRFSEYPVSSGGYGDVYRGVFRDGTLVAVKCLRLHADSAETTKKQLKRVARELYVWSKCDHPNVLGLIGVAQYRDQIAMVSPWMERGSLRRVLMRVEPADRYMLCWQIADGVAYMHSKNMAHGDLKCDNVLVSSDFTPKLTDFGNASLKEYTLQFTSTTSSAGISLNWVAPEMLAGQNQATMESDVYSLGMTMLELITGTVPYEGMSQHMIIVTKIMTKTFPPRPEAHIPSQTRHGDLLWSLLENCWAFEPPARPSAAEVKERMEQVVAARGSGYASG